MKINGLEVKKEDNIFICENGKFESIETIRKMANSYYNFSNYFEVEKNNIVPGDIFGMVVKIDDILNLSKL